MRDKSIVHVVAAVLAFGFAMLYAGRAYAQDAVMFKYPEQLAPLHLDPQGTNGWSATVTQFTPTSAVIYPGEKVSFQFELSNKGKTALDVAPIIEITRVGMHFERYDPKRGDAMIGGQVISTTLLSKPQRTTLPAVSIAPGKTATVQWEQANAKDFSEFGAYAVVMEIPGKGRQAIATFARVHTANPDAGDGKDSPLMFSLAWNWPLDQQLAVVSRLGYKWVRTDGFPNWNGASQADVYAPFDWTNEDKAIAEYRKYGLYILSNEYGSPASTITPDNVKAYNMVQDEKYDSRWGDFIQAVVARYCGADGKGPLQIIDFWNEPWEGGGISGWKSDSIRYRQLYKILYDRGHEGSSHIMIGGTSSIMNTVDKFFTVANWKDQYKLDVSTDHYVQPYCCFGPRIAKALGIPSLETETWIGNTPDNLVAVATHFLAAGQQKVNPNHPSQLLWSNGSAGPMCTPTAVAANFFLNYVAGKSFNKIAFKDHLPWLYQWGEGKDAVFILAGDRSRLNQDAHTMYDQIKANGTITISSLGGKLRMFDEFGNPIKPKHGKYVVPCAYKSVYLCAPGLEASKVISAVSDGVMQDVRPVEFFVRDFAQPVVQSKDLLLSIHNVLTQKVTGTLKVTAPDGFQITQIAGPITLASGETKKLEVPIVSAKPDAANAYDFTFLFTSKQGKAEWKETLNATTIIYGDPKMDGNLADWQDTPSITLYSSKLKRDMTEAAWKPWEKEQDVNGMAQIRVKWDDQNLYVMAREHNTKWAPKPRLSTRDENSYFGTGDMAHTYIRGFEDTSPFDGSVLQVGIGIGPHDTGLIPDNQVPEKMIAQNDTDYEFDVWGTPDGGAEVWRSAAPGAELFNFLPRCMPAGYTGVVPGVKGFVKREGDDTIYEMSIPFSELHGLVPAAGQDVRLTFALPGSDILYGDGRSVTRSNGLTLKPTWQPHPSCDIKWGFVK